MSFTIKLYKSHAERERLNKTNFLENEIELTGVLRDATSVISPVIRIEYDGNISQYNYAYISQFGRYYYINDIISVRNKLWEVHMTCDVLMSYKKDILNTKAVIEKQQGSKYTSVNYNDGSFRFKESNFPEVWNFSNGFNDNGTFVLMTAGAIATPTP